MPTLPAGWMPIESAPKTGRTLLLGYWNSHGKWRTVRGQWMSAEYIGQEWEEPDEVEAGWFETAVEADDVPNCWPVSPSHWQPMPEPPCQTCNDQGAVGNILTAEPCPDCTPPASAQDDALSNPALQKLFGDAITGALGFGAQGVNPPPKGHWLEPFWQMARADAAVAADARALLDHPLLRDVLGYVEDAGPADVWGAAQSWMALRDAASQQQEG